MSKRLRDHSATLEGPLKMTHTDYAYVNPFDLMMNAAKHTSIYGSSAQQADGQDDGNVPFSFDTAPCSHCSKQLMETQLKQCHNCQEVFCSTCSLANYEEREDRVFCLDCNIACCRKPCRPAAVPSISSPLKRHIMQACAQVSAQADMTPLSQAAEAAAAAARAETPSSAGFAGGAFGSPQLGNMLGHQQHWPAAHMQCRAGGRL